MLSRQEFLRLVAGVSLGALSFSGKSFASDPGSEETTPIDRKSVVRRFNVHRSAFNGSSPLQVGNGDFAFGADITGLQSFAGFNTMSYWGWHEFPLPPGQKPEDFRGIVYKTHGRDVTYESPNADQPELGHWLYQNPHRINLGRIGLLLVKSDGSEAVVDDLTNTSQELDLWSGTLSSSFTFDGQPINVVTCACPEPDGVVVSIKSPLMSAGRIKLYVDFPYDDQNEFASSVGDWSSDNNHTTTLLNQSTNRADLSHTLDSTTYYTSLQWTGAASLTPPAASAVGPKLTVISALYGADNTWADVTPIIAGFYSKTPGSFAVGNSQLGGDPYLKHVKSLKVTYALDGEQHSIEVGEGGSLQLLPDSHAHRYIISGQGDTLSVLIAFAPTPLQKHLPSPAQAVVGNSKMWSDYWNSGGFIDLSGSTDPRSKELQRRIILSQYLMKVNEAGTLPPQESGLVNNGWNGKFHMEMYWWHAAHWALWNKWREIDKSSGVYKKFLASSQARAKRQGYRGARWPKMVGPYGRNSPYIIHGLLIWQQPHPIFFAELEYRAKPTEQTLNKWKEVVSETAEFMATYAFWDDATKRYVLGPPVFVVSENTDPFVTINPTFELSYWRFGLRTAQTWRERLGMQRDPEWDKVLANLAALPQQDGAYVLYEGVPDMWTKYNYEHPALIGVFGWLPGDGVDATVMAKTVEMVKEHWNMGHVWGWDMPVLAMNAARSGDQERAIDMLLLANGNFDFDDAGLSTGGPFPYFPSNGGLLYATAFMASGWDGSGTVPAAGFPQDGTWIVKYEGLGKAI